ncbi:uncharacterized protein EAF02_011555 [Botrytis sinoallii]|uniref:uncharacterized protein n=1 Tax=Botrytis sinoallii TaxID=1463999 RepID=UPI001901449D|nr:uncharacterized protein EAF02_011555 [Botrytis sinoallii]KAF7855296.1 hypothetical protein EAF02_011555 [Botrytis sinoallii]
MTLNQDEALSSKDTVSIDKDMGAVAITDVSSPASLQTFESDELFLHSWRLAAVIGSLCLGIFLLALDMNIIAVAIPRITSDFHALNDVAWYGSAYLLTVTAFQPLFGNLYKYFDPKIVYMGSIALFESPSSSVLIGGRSVLGFGAAGIYQGSLAIVNFVVELEKRPMYQGIVISSFAISVCIGPVLGGVFTDKASWRWCFWINVPMGAVVLVFIVLFFRIKGVRNSNRALDLPTKLKRMDIGGVLLFLGAIYCLLLALQWGGQTSALEIIKSYWIICWLWLTHNILRHPAMETRRTCHNSLAYPPTKINPDGQYIPHDIWHDEFCLCLLSTHLLSIHSRRHSNPKWHSIHRDSPSSNHWPVTYWSCGYKMGDTTFHI